MKLQDLLEGPPPVFNPKEMPSAQIFGTGKFYSEKTIKQKFDIIGQFEKDDKKYFVILDKNLEFGCVIYAGLREADQERGGFIVASIDFKNPINITYDRDVTYDRSKVIQVDGVEIYKSEDKRLGLGFYLYLSLIKAGYVVISDNYQYIGGKELWKKIIKMASTFISLLLVFEAISENLKACQ